MTPHHERLVRTVAAGVRAKFAAEARAFGDIKTRARRRREEALSTRHFLRHATVPNLDAARRARRRKRRTFSMRRERRRRDRNHDRNHAFWETRDVPPVPPDPKSDRFFRFRRRSIRIAPNAKKTTSNARTLRERSMTKHDVCPPWRRKKRKNKDCDSRSSSSGARTSSTPRSSTWRLSPTAKANAWTPSRRTSPPPPSPRRAAQKC